MNKLSTTLAALLLVLSASSSWSQSSEESAAKAAEQAGKLREALTQYVAALQKTTEGSADDQRLRETIIKLVQRLSPPPAVPEEAQRYMGRGQAAVEIVKGPEDFKRAIGEFQKALRSAPWLANGYYNLAVVQEKLGDFQAAMRNFKLYLLAAPGATDAQQIQARIYGLEFKVERQKEETRAAETAERKRTQQATPILGLAGTWQGSGSRFQAAVSGNSIVITLTHSWDGSVWVPRHGASYGLKFEGDIEGLSIRGVYVVDYRPTWRNGEIFTRPMTGTISPDGRRIHLEYISVGPAGSRPGNLAAGWSEAHQSTDLERQ